MATRRCWVLGFKGVCHHCLAKHSSNSLIGQVQVWNSPVLEALLIRAFATEGPLCPVVRSYNSTLFCLLKAAEGIPDL